MPEELPKVEQVPKPKELTEQLSLEIGKLSEQILGQIKSKLGTMTDMDKYELDGRLGIAKNYLLDMLDELKNPEEQ